MNTNLVYETTTNEKIAETQESQNGFTGVNQELIEAVGTEFKELELGDKTYFFHPEVQNIADIFSDNEHWLYASVNGEENYEDNDYVFESKEAKQNYVNHFHRAVHFMLLHAHELQNTGMCLKEFHLLPTYFNKDSGTLDGGIDMDYQGLLPGGLLHINTEDGKMILGCYIEHQDGENKIKIKKKITEFNKIDEEILKGLKIIAEID